MTTFEFIVIEGDRVTVPRESKHRIRNVGDYPLQILEIQYGRCEEDDIVRFEDDYGRHLSEDIFE